MGEEKRNKIIAAIVVNAVLLVFVLLAVVISQIVEINVKQRRKAALLDHYYALVREYENGKDFIDKYEYDSQITNLIIEMKNSGFTEEEIYKFLVDKD